MFELFAQIDEQRQLEMEAVIEDANRQIHLQQRHDEHIERKQRRRDRMREQMEEAALAWATDEASALDGAP